MNKANFKVDYNKCVGCKKCINVCPGGVLFMDENRKVKITDFNEFGWNGCWKCEHCLAVCPTGAITIFNKNPNDSIPMYNSDVNADAFDLIVMGRHSCRRFKNESVNPQIISKMIDLLANAPNGGNKQQVEFTLIDSKKQMDVFRKIAYSRMEELAGEGIYPKGFDKSSYEDMKRWEKTVRPDMLFCSAPHLLIPHAPLGNGEPIPDTIIAGAYFELLCAAHGIGAVVMTFPLDVLNCMPDIKAMLKIPESHYIGMIIGFGYPEIKYARCKQKEMDKNRIHRITFEEKIYDKRNGSITCR